MAALGLRPTFLERRAEALGNTFLPDALPAEAAKRSHSIGRCSFDRAAAAGGEAAGRPALRTSRSGRLSKEAASYVPLAQEQKTVLALFDALSLAPDDQSTSASSGSARSAHGLNESERSCSPCGTQVLETDLGHHQATEGENIAMDPDCSAPLMGYILQPVQPDMEECAFTGDYVDYGDYAEYSFPYEHAHFSEAPPQFTEAAQFSDSAQFRDSVQFGEVVQFSEATQFSDHVQFSEVAQFSEHAQFSETPVTPWCWSEDGDWTGQGFIEGDWRMHGF